MLSQGDIEAGVAGGILTPEQADRLLALAKKRAGAAEAHTNPALPAAANPDDERFRLFSGFNDVFLAIGVALVSAACISQTSWKPDPKFLPLLAGAVLSWGLAELLVARYRAVLPGIVACLSFALFCGLLAGTLASIQWPFVPQPDSQAQLYSGDTGFQGNRYVVLVFFLLGALAAALAFFARFRFPFALLIAGLSLAFAVLTGCYWAYGAAGGALANRLALATGLGLFLAAMAFDSSDRLRLTRRSDCGFWLHLAAAPFIVHPLISASVGATAGMASSGALTIFAFVAVLATIALIVDRRAILVSSLLYLGTAVAVLIKESKVPPEAGITVTLAVLGLLVVLLGLGWGPLRRLLLGPLAGNPVLQWLPPVTPITEARSPVT